MDVAAEEEQQLDHEKLDWFRPRAVREILPFCVRHEISRPVCDPYCAGWRDSSPCRPA